MSAIITNNKVPLINQLALCSLLLVVSIQFMSCSEVSRTDRSVLNSDTAVSLEKGAIYEADTGRSFVSFTGYGPGHHHTGHFHLLNGRLSVEGPSITGGGFDISIPSMALEEKGASIQNKLRPHLLGPDFFDAAHYPIAHFSLSAIRSLSVSSLSGEANYLVSGNLTLKNITRNISFPAHLLVSKDSVTGSGRFVINRRWWRMNYGNDRSLGNRFISESVIIQLFIVAARVLRES